MLISITWEQWGVRKINKAYPDNWVYAEKFYINNWLFENKFWIQVLKLIIICFKKYCKINRYIHTWNIDVTSEVRLDIFGPIENVLRIVKWINKWIKKKIFLDYGQKSRKRQQRVS